MAKKKKQTEPAPGELVDEPVSGFPQDGEPHPDKDDPPPEPEPQDEPEPESDPLAELRAEMQEMRRENQELRQMIPPAHKPKQEPQPSDNEPDWEKLLFDNPNEALRLHGERVREQVRKELQSEYQRDQGTQKFWNDFFRKNGDLEEDRDLVEMTLNSNLNKLANLPVSEAIDQLADLTRQRILRYSGSQPKSKGKKAVAEGAESPKPRAPAKEEPNVTSLSDLIKARKAKRTTAA